MCGSCISARLNCLGNSAVLKKWLSLYLVAGSTVSHCPQAMINNMNLPTVDRFLLSTTVVPICDSLDRFLLSTAAVPVFDSLLLLTVQQGGLGFATLRYAMLRYATLCYAMLRYATLCYATLPSYLPCQVFGRPPEVSLACRPGSSTGTEGVLLGGADAHEVDAVEVVQHPPPSF